jgi:hypothetical protein
VPSLPEKRAQIVQVHAGLIHAVVVACSQPELRPEVEKALQVSAENGWTELVRALRLVLVGRRDPGVLIGLDEEDTVIVQAVLQGLQDRSSLPDPAARPDSAVAAPGLAAMVHAAARGNSEALQILAAMAEQMSRVKGDMAHLAAIIRPLVNGERNPDKLCKRMGPQGRQLVLLILEELGRLEAH